MREAAHIEVDFTYFVQDGAGHRAAGEDGLPIASL